MLALLPEPPAAVPRSAVGAGRVTTLVPAEAEHPAAGSFYLDDCFPEAWLRRLESTFAALPVAEAAKAEDSTRRYFRDLDGWVVDGVAAALAHHTLPCRRAFEHCPKLHRN